MFDLPKAGVKDFPRFADWVELCALFDDDGTLSRVKLADAVRDASLIGNLESDFFKGDELFLDHDTLSSEEGGERFGEQVWEELKKRVVLLGQNYPFQVSGSILSRPHDSWRENPTYALLLLADILRYYDGLSRRVEPNTAFQRLFEKMTVASAAGLFKGASLRFGWPRDSGWPTGIKERIHFLGEKMRLTVENLGGKVDPRDKDRSLDAVCRLSLGDDGPGTIVLLMQCATGRNWKNKRGEPVLALWRDIFRWDAKLVGSVAIPWRLDESFNYTRTFRHFDEAVVLDRFRLLAGAPDTYLSVESRQEILTWCESQVQLIPKLKV